MIYALEENKFHSFNELDHKKYDFYKDGCKIETAKLEQFLNKNQNSPVVAKLKKVTKETSTMKEMFLEKLKETLNEEDRQLFSSNQGVIFEEWKKFQYLIYSNQNEVRLDPLVVENIQKIFKGGEKDEIISLKNEELDFLLKYWRECLHNIHSEKDNKQ